MSIALMFMALALAPTQAASGEGSPARPMNSPAGWVLPNDYPAESARAGEEGTVGFALTIGTAGRPLACKITAPSGFPRLDEMACRAVMFRADFTPARDARGDPVPGRYRSSVRWVLPEGAAEFRPPPLEPFEAEIVIIVNAEGKMEDCVARVIEGPEAAVMGACESAPIATLLSPGFGGGPARRRVTIRNSFDIEELPPE